MAPSSRLLRRWPLPCSSFVFWFLSCTQPLNITRCGEIDVNVDADVRVSHFVNGRVRERKSIFINCGIGKEKRLMLSCSYLLLLNYLPKVFIARVLIEPSPETR